MPSQPPPPTPAPSDARAVAERLLATLAERAVPENVEGMARYGISPEGTLGVSMPVVRELARITKAELKKAPDARHEVAGHLWDSGVHEARILAALVDVPALVTESQMERWATSLDSWDVCDQLCGNLFDKTPLAWNKAREWSGRDPEFVKRAGFVLMTQLAVHDKSAEDSLFEGFFELIIGESNDDRPYVKRAVNWALRQIGKRSERLNALSIVTAEEILARYPDSTPARWIARDALRELRSEAVQERLATRRS